METKPKKRTVRLQITYCGEQFRDLYVRIADAKGMTFSETFCFLIEDVSAHPALHSKIIEFTKRTEGCWNTQGPMLSMFPDITPQIRDVAEYHAFLLFGDGKISPFFRALVNFYAVRLRLIEEPTQKIKPSVPIKSNFRKTKKVGVDNEVETTFSLSDVTRQQVANIMVMRRLRRVVALRTMIEEASRSEKHLKNLKKFYIDRYEEPEPGTVKFTAQRLRCSETHLSLLKNLSMEVIGEHQRSKMLRLLIAYFSETLARDN